MELPGYFPQERFRRMRLRHQIKQRWTVLMQVAQAGSQRIERNRRGWTSRVVPIEAQGPAGFKWVGLD